MDNCNEFVNGDFGVLEEYMLSIAPFQEPITLKLYTGTIAGDPTKGIAKTFTYNQRPYKAIVSNIMQKDLVLSGGIYQLGDITIQLDMELKEIDDKTGSPGDRVIWRNHEYRPVGRIATDYLAGYVLFNYAFRRV
jgi:hypothetical protein